MLTELYVKAMVYLASLKNEEGQGMAEYGLILALIAVVVIGVLATIGDDLIAKFTEISTGLTSAGGGG